MKVYTFMPTGDYFKAKSKKAIAEYLKRNTRGFEKDTMKEFMKGYSDRSSLLGKVVRFDTEAHFIDDLFKVKDLVEGNKADKLMKPSRVSKKKK